MAQVETLFPVFTNHTGGWFQNGVALLLVTLDRTTPDFAHLLGQEVLIDGQCYRCQGVERFLHSPPWYRGEPIGLLVRKAAEPQASLPGDMGHNS